MVTTSLQRKLLYGDLSARGFSGMVIVSLSLGLLSVFVAWRIDGDPLTSLN